MKESNVDKCNLIVEQATDFPEFLELTLKLRKNNNNSYSLRAFARDLKISVSHLFSIMNRTSNASVLILDRICTQLGLSPDMTSKVKKLNIECRNSAGFGADTVKLNLSDFELIYVNGEVKIRVLNKGLKTMKNATILKITTDGFL